MYFFLIILSHTIYYKSRKCLEIFITHFNSTLKTCPYVKKRSYGKILGTCILDIKLRIYCVFSELDFSNHNKPI